LAGFAVSTEAARCRSSAPAAPRRSPGRWSSSPPTRRTSWGARPCTWAAAPAY